MRQSWTDDRLDDLNGKVDALRLEMKAEFAADREKRADERFNAGMHRLDTMHALMNWLTGICFGPAIGLIATQI